jgi:putative spermidine/putrescine transport system permease protein
VGNEPAPAGVLEQTVTSSMHDLASTRLEPRVRTRLRVHRQSLYAVLLIGPCLLFLLITFALPIAAMLFRSVEDPELADTLPRTAAAFQAWDGVALPPESLVRIFVRDVAAATEIRTIGIAARRLNFEVPGFRGLLLQTARALPDPEAPDLLQRLSKADVRWQDPLYWRAIKTAAPRFTARYFLAAAGLQPGSDGTLVQPDPKRQIYPTLLARTLWISLVVTVLCVVLAYPVAYLLATAPAKYGNLLMLLLLLPFWTSLLVRTTAWLVLLQNEGLVNHALVWAGLFDEPQQLIRNRLGLYVAMTHILLPFMILPLFSVMKGIPPVLMRAAYSLGAGPVRAFFRIYLPQTLPGLGAGALLVFIMSLGYYITPALVGGPGDQMLSYFIAENASATLNWGMAGALSLALLACVAVALVIFARIGSQALRLRS